MREFFELIKTFLSERKNAAEEVRKKERYEYYLQEKSRLEAREVNQSNFFDKTILTLAGGSFGVSFIFIEKIIGPDGIARCKALLTGSWSFYLLSILLTVIALLCGQSVHTKLIERNDERYKLKMKKYGSAENQKKITDSIEKLDRRAAAYNSCICVLNWLSLIAFVLGTVLIIVFAGINF